MQMADEIINIAIIGAGRGGLGLFKLFRDNPMVRIQAIVDKNPEAPGLRIAEKSGTRTITRIEDLKGVGGIDLYINATGDDSVIPELTTITDDPSRIMNGQISNVIYRLMIETIQLNREIYRASRYLESIFQHSGDMIITTDRNGKIVRFNKRGQDLLGYTEEEMVGRFMHDFYLHAEDRKEALLRLKRDGHLSDFKTKLLAKDGRTVGISLSLKALQDERGEEIGTVGISRESSFQVD